MRIYRRKILLFCLTSSDVVIFLLSVVLTLRYTKQLSSYHTIMSSKMSISDFLLLLFFLIFWICLCRFYHLYHSRRLQNSFVETKDITKAVLSFILATTLAVMILQQPLLTVSNVIILSCCIFGLTIGFRLLLRLFLRLIRFNGRNLRNALIIGTNQTAYSWANEITNSPEHGINIFGFVDDKIIQNNTHWPYLGKIETLPTILKENIIDEVIIALPIMSNYPLIQRVIHFADEQGLQVRYAFPLFDTRLSTQIKDYGSLDKAGFMITQCPYKPWEFIVKRVFDIFLASLLLLLLSPLMLLVGVLIKIASVDSPIFFTQTRVGFNKRPFTCYKFQTMVTNAEELQKTLEGCNEMDGAAFKMRNDPRITPLGKFLRRTSIDEVPQLFNVIKGDLSLVGPRPLPVCDYERFEQTWQCRRLSVLPGITCIWQISGRNNISFDKWMEFDMSYIDNWSLWMDVKILLKTVPAVITARGAR